MESLDLRTAIRLQTSVHIEEVLLFETNHTEHFIGLRFAEYEVHFGVALKPMKFTLLHFYVRLLLDRPSSLFEIIMSTLFES